MPSTLQQVQIEHATKNSKPRNGFEFSYKPPAAAAPQQRPQSQAAFPPTTRQSIGSFVEVLGSSYCSSCRSKLCGVTSSCSQCKRGVHEHCFVTVGGEGHRWCFACACRGCQKPLGNTDTQQCKQCKCYVHVECALDGSCLQCAQPICPPCPKGRCVWGLQMRPRSVGSCLGEKWVRQFVPLIWSQDGDCTLFWTQCPSALCECSPFRGQFAPSMRGAVHFAYA